MVAARAADDPVIAEIAEELVVAIGRTGSGTGGGQSGETAQSSGAGQGKGAGNGG